MKHLKSFHVDEIDANIARFGFSDVWYSLKHSATLVDRVIYLLWVRCSILWKQLRSKSDLYWICLTTLEMELSWSESTRRYSKVRQVLRDDFDVHDRRCRRWVSKGIDQWTCPELSAPKILWTWPNCCSSLILHCLPVCSFFYNNVGQTEMRDGLGSLRQPDGLELHPMLTSTELTRTFRLNSGAHVFCSLKQVLRES